MTAAGAMHATRAQEWDVVPIPSSTLTHSEVAFSGVGVSMDWVIQSSPGLSGEARLSVFRVLDSTVVPMEANIPLGTIDLKDGEREVVSYTFTPPQSDRPASYLFRLSFATDVSEKVLANRFLSTIPADLLKQHRGTSVLLIGFKEGEDKTTEFLENCGWKISHGQSITGGEEADLILFSPEAASNPPAGKSLVLRDLSDWGGLDRPTVTILARNSAGESLQIQIPEPDWRALPTSASLQRMLSRITGLAKAGQ